MYKSKYIHGGLYLSRSEKKAAFSSYSSPALYNGQVTWRKELNKKAVTHYIEPDLSRMRRQLSSHFYSGKVPHVYILTCTLLKNSSSAFSKDLFPFEYPL